MQEQVRLDGLLFSSDGQVLRVMNQILDNFAIRTEVCTEVDLALDAVTHRRLDTVIVDWSHTNDPTRVVRSALEVFPQLQLDNRRDGRRGLGNACSSGRSQFHDLQARGHQPRQPVHTGGIWNHVARTSTSRSDLGRHSGDCDSPGSRDC